MKHWPRAWIGIGSVALVAVPKRHPLQAECKARLKLYESGKP